MYHYICWRAYIKRSFAFTTPQRILDKGVNKEQVEYLKMKGTNLFELAYVGFISRYDNDASAVSIWGWWMYKIEARDLLKNEFCNYSWLKKARNKWPF
jgi:hypothetical protein